MKDKLISIAPLQSLAARLGRCCDEIVNCGLDLLSSDQALYTTGTVYQVAGTYLPYGTNNKTFTSVDCGRGQRCSNSPTSLRLQSDCSLKICRYCSSFFKTLFPSRGRNGYLHLHVMRTCRRSTFLHRSLDSTSIAKSSRALSVLRGSRSSRLRSYKIDSSVMSGDI